MAWALYEPLYLSHHHHHPCAPECSQWMHTKYSLANMYREDENINFRGYSQVHNVCNKMLVHLSFGQPASHGPRSIEPRKLNHFYCGAKLESSHQNVVIISAASGRTGRHDKISIIIVVCRVQARPEWQQRQKQQANVNWGSIVRLRQMDSNLHLPNVSLLLLLL